MLYIAYYTIGSPYEGESRILIESLEALGLQHDVVGIPSLGSWQKNTQYKSRFVREMLKKHPDQPIVYLDVDAIVLRVPWLFDFVRPNRRLDCDIAAAMFAEVELLGGTVYFSPTSKTIEVVDRWCELCERYPETFPGGLLPHFPNGCFAWDQRLLDIAIRQTEARFRELPPEYAYIVGLSQCRYPHMNPIILHTRGRLRFEKTVNASVCPPANV